MGLAAFGGGVIGYSFPLDLLDRLLATAGASTAVPLLAPPLGSTARILIIVGSMAIVAALTAIVSPWKKGRARVGDQPQPFFSTMEAPDDFIPVLRRSDAHPDAPARPPVFASRDLGHEALPPALPDQPEDLTATFDRIWPKQDGQADVDPDLPPALEPMPWETIQAEMDRLLSGVRFRPVDEAPAIATAGEVPERTDDEGDGHSLPSIAELIARLERGLARHRTPAVADEDTPAADVPTDATVRVG